MTAVAQEDFPAGLPKSDKKDRKAKHSKKSKSKHTEGPAWSKDCSNDIQKWCSDKTVDDETCLRYHSSAIHDQTCRYDLGIGPAPENGGKPDAPPVRN